MIRKRSTTEIFGWPMFHLAWGADLERGELRGHAKGVILVHARHN